MLFISENVFATNSSCMLMYNVNSLDILTWSCPASVVVASPTELMMIMMVMANRRRRAVDANGVLYKSVSGEFVIHTGEDRREFRFCGAMKNANYFILRVLENTSTYVRRIRRQSDRQTKDMQSCKWEPEALNCSPIEG